MYKTSPLQLFQNTSKGKLRKFISPIVTIELETRLTYTWIFGFWTYFINWLNSVIDTNTLLHYHEFCFRYDITNSDVLVNHLILIEIHLITASKSEDKSKHL